MAGEQFKSSTAPIPSILDSSAAASRTTSKQALSAISPVNANITRSVNPLGGSAADYTGPAAPSFMTTAQYGSVDTSAANYSGMTAPNMSQTNMPTSVVRNPNEDYMQGGANLTTRVPQNEEDQGKFGYKVRLFAVRNFPIQYVIFEASPVLSESRTVDYAPVTPVHMPGSIQVYKRTNSRAFSLTAQLISRNVEQAGQNMKYLQLLRGWTMPYFGIRSGTDGFTRSDMTSNGWDAASNNGTIDDRTSMLGAPPDVLYLYAYTNNRNSSEDRMTMVDGQINLKKLPVVITSLGIDYPDDVDYIPASPSGEPFPVKMSVRIELAETHSPKGYEQFSLSMFKKGQLVQF